MPRRAVVVAFLIFGACKEAPAPGACDGITCSEHGDCAVIAGTTPVCVCASGFRAAALGCEALTPGSECAGVDCSTGGTCAVSNGTPLCVCGAGFQSLGATQCVANAEDPCVGQPCSAHGTCAVSMGAALCVCQSGFHPSGLSCVADVVGAECVGVDCADHGSCVVVQGQPSTPLCQCAAGFHAMGATTCVPNPVDPCAGQTCSGRGTCAVASGTPLCVCGPGYHASALTCLADPQGAECQGIDCTSSGTCVVVEGTPKTALCLCGPGTHAVGTTNCAVGPAEGGTCGNGFLEIHGPGAADDEQCDNGTPNDSVACDSDCTIPVCGDGHLNLTREACDPGAIGLDVALCNADCTVPACGDGKINRAFTPPLGSAPEACDDGNTSSGDGCSATCELEPFALTVTKLGSGVGSVVSSAPGINCGTDCSELYASGAVVTLTATPGASTAFTGWSGGGCNGTGTCVVTLSAARSVLATFQLDVLNVALAGSGAGVITGTGISCGPDCSEVFDAGAVVTLIPIPAADSNFAGWSGDCVGLACALTMSSARNVTATFNLNQYLLSVSKVGQGTINSGPAGIACGPDCTEPYASGTSVTLVASPQAGWSFSSWSGAAGCTTSPICAVTVTASQTVTATFTQNTYVLTTVKTGNGTGVVTSSPGTINCGATCAATFFSGASVLLTANAATNNTFLGWSGAGCTGTGTCAVAMNQAETVSARFGLVPRLLTVTKAGVNAPLGSVTVTPAGINCGAGCTSYDDGTVVVLTAAPGVAPDGGSTFTGWTGCSSATGLLCVVTMNAARNVNATFD